jgi:hypothetical protein
MGSVSGKRQLMAVAIPYEKESLARPLLYDVDTEATVEFEDERSRNDRLMRRIQVHSLLYGMFVGFFVECGAIIAHVLYQTYEWQDRTPSTMEILLFSVTWASVTSVLPCVALTFLRTLLVTSHRVSQSSSSSRVVAANAGSRDPSLDVILWNLESRFGVGSFLGVSLAVTVLDFTLGLRSHIVLTAVLLSVVVGSYSFLNRVRAEWRGESPKRSQRTVAEPSSTRKNMESVDPSSLKNVEIKPGTLLIV